MIEVIAGQLVCTSADDREITFGRSPTCTIKIDTDRRDERLSRITGAFRRQSGHWQLHNESGRLDLVVELDGGLRSVVQPGAWPFILPHGVTGRVTLQTTRQYSLRFAVKATPPDAGASRSADPFALADETVTGDMATALALTADELTMLAALCEPRLRDPDAGSWALPSTRDTCTRIGITPKRAEDVVDSLARKFAPVVDGLFGDNGGRATTRRQRLADFALRTRCVTTADLRRLPPLVR